MTSNMRSKNQATKICAKTFSYYSHYAIKALFLNILICSSYNVRMMFYTVV